MKNGRDDPGKVTSLAGARRAREEAARTAKRNRTPAHATRLGPGRAKGDGTVRQWLFGAVLIAMAAGMLVWWIDPSLLSPGSSPATLRR